MSVLLAGCGTATRTQSSSVVIEKPSAPVVVDQRDQRQVILIQEEPRLSRTPRYPYTSEIPQKPMPQSDVIPRDNGEVYHVYGGRVTHIERPAWTQKRKD